MSLAFVLSLVVSQAAVTPGTPPPPVAPTADAPATAHEARPVAEPPCAMHGAKGEGHEAGCTCAKHGGEHGDDCGCSKPGGDAHGAGCTCAKHRGEHGEEMSCAKHGGEHGEEMGCAKHGGEHGEEMGCAKHGGEHGEEMSCAKHGGEHGEEMGHATHGGEHGDDCGCPMGMKHGKHGHHGMRGDHEMGDEAPMHGAHPVGAMAASGTDEPNFSSRFFDTAKVSGYARVGYFATFPFRDEELVGGHAGFRVADFRLGLEFSPAERLVVGTSIELSSAFIDPNDPLSGRRGLELKDAFLDYSLHRMLHLKVGQFRPGYYAEMLQSDATIPFISRSILATGVTPPEAYGPSTPLAPDRQVGLQLASERLGDDDGIGFTYAVGVFNGNGANALFNDNNSVAPFARVEADWAHKVTLGLNGSYNTLAQGTRPNRLYTTQVGYGADLTAHVWKLDVLLGYLGRHNTYSFAGLPADSTSGFMGQVRYFSDKTGLEAAARLAWMDPSSAQKQDAVTEGALMFGWRPFHQPFRVLAQYTMRQEEAGASYPNDSVDVMLHATW